MPQAGTIPALELTYCVLCGHENYLPPDIASCEHCGLEADEETVVLTGATGTSGELLAIFFGWMMGIGLLASAGLVLAASITSIAMATHLGVRLMELWGRDSRRLVIAARGVALTRQRGRANFSRWHLFDQARLELVADAINTQYDHTQPRWRLTLVNAYKPSISSYLHRRGTDAPIFAEAIVFSFQAAAEQARTLQTTMEQYIRSSTARYCALRLKEMHLPAIDPARVFRLHVCPCCDHDLRREAATGQCPGCGHGYQAGDLLLRGTPIGFGARYGWIAFSLLLVGMGALIVSQSPAFLAAALAGAMAGVYLLGHRESSAASRHPRYVATRRGVEVFSGGQRTARHDWSQLRECRAEEMEFGHWRLALWDQPQHSIRFSRLYFGWVVTPGGRPVIDLLLRADERTGRMICDEVRQRVYGESGEFPGVRPV